MWIKNLAAAVLILLSQGTLFAQEQQTSKEIKHALGASVGWIVGSGLSYRHYFDNYYAQTSFVASVKELSDDSRINDDIYLDLAFSFGKYLHVDRPKKWLPIALKWMGGIEWIYEKQPRCEFDDVSKSCIEKSKTQNTLHLGGGIGLDIGRIKTQGLIFSIDLSFLATFEEGKFEGLHAPWPAASLLYNW